MIPFETKESTEKLNNLNQKIEYINHQLLAMTESLSELQNTITKLDSS